MQPDLTPSEISRSSRKMSRPKNDHEPVLIRFQPGTRDRIRASLREGEDNASFVRLAVDAELKRREKAASPRATRRGTEGG